MMRLLFLLLFGVTGAATLIGLGTWQLQRLDWKESVIAEINARIGDAPTALPAQPSPDTDRYQPVEVSGSFLPGEIHVLTSIKNIGPGYRLIAPFQTESGRRILIDRGFILEADKDAARMPSAATIEGNLHWPQETDSYTPEPDLAKNMWFARDVERMAAALDTEPVFVIARSDTGDGVAPLPIDTSGIPNDHLNYAITWFSLAAIWIAMTTYFLWRPRARKTS